MSLLRRAPARLAAALLQLPNLCLLTLGLNFPSSQMEEGCPHILPGLQRTLGDASVLALCS